MSVLTSRARTLALATTGTAVGFVLLAGPALAHVTVTAPGATSGGSDQEITFRVPVEKTIDTTGLTVQLPTDTPIASVLVEPVPGWTHTEVNAKLAKPIVTDDGDITEAVTQITWKAEPGQGLTPGEFGAFTIIAGQLPDASSLTFKALQTYSDGSVVRWIQLPAPGSTDEPENPAPILTLAKATPDSSSGSASSAPSSAVTVTSKPAATSTSSSSNTGPVVLSIVALVIAVAALAFGVVSRARNGSSTGKKAG